jgi:hypothetical protein
MVLKDTRQRSTDPGLFNGVEDLSLVELIAELRVESLAAVTVLPWRAGFVAYLSQLEDAILDNTQTIGRKNRLGS